MIDLVGNVASIIHMHVVRLVGCVIPRSFYIPWNFAEIKIPWQDYLRSTGRDGLEMTIRWSLARLVPDKAREIFSIARAARA
jgi:hypothetical protein